MSKLIHNGANYYVSIKIINYAIQKKMKLHYKIKTQYHLKDASDIIHKYSSDLNEFLFYNKNITSSIFNIIGPFIWILYNSYSNNFFIIIILQIISNLSIYKLITFTKKQEEIYRELDLNVQNSNRQLSHEYQCNTSQANSFINVTPMNENKIKFMEIYIEKLWICIWLITEIQTVLIDAATIYLTYQMESVIELIIFSSMSNITNSIDRICNVENNEKFYRLKLTK